VLSPTSRWVGHGHLVAEGGDEDASHRQIDLRGCRRRNRDRCDRSGYAATHEQWNVWLIGDSRRWTAGLLSVLGIEEITQITRLINSRSYTALEGFIPLALAYLAVTLPLSWVAGRLERRFAYET